MKYFITGATGFIGSHVTWRLLDAGHEVVALVRSPQKAAWLAEKGATLAQGDITDRESLRAPMTGVDGLFHLAAWYELGVRDKGRMHQINVDGTRNVLEVMKELDIPKGVYTSTLAVFSDTRGKMVDETYRYVGPHISEYDRTKWLAHYEVAEPVMREGLPLVIVQPGAVYGPGDTSSLGDAFREYLQGKLLMLPKGTTFCWSHVDDIAQAHILAMEKGRPGESYIIAGPPHSFEDVFAIAERVTGVKVPRLRLGPGALKALSKVTAVVGAFARLPAAFTAEGLRAIAATTYLASNEKAKRELGYGPRPLEEGLRETLTHVMEELGPPRSS